MPAHPMRNSFSKRRQTCQTFFDVKGLLAIEIHLKIQKVLKEFARSSSLFENGLQRLNVTKPNQTIIENDQCGHVQYHRHCTKDP